MGLVVQTVAVLAGLVVVILLSNFRVERRARVITADGELQASHKLAQAAEVMSDHSAALELRLLQTVVEVAAEKNSTLVLPFPVELLRFLERATPSSTGAQALPNDAARV